MWLFVLSATQKLKIVWIDSQNISVKIVKVEIPMLKYWHFEYMILSLFMILRFVKAGNLAISNSISTKKNVTLHPFYPPWGLSSSSKSAQNGWLHFSMCNHWLQTLISLGDIFLNYSLIRGIMNSISWISLFTLLIKW